MPVFNSVAAPALSSAATPVINRLIRILAGLCLVLLSQIAVADLATEKTLKIGISTSFPPFNYLDDKGQISGFNADVSLAVCQQMQRRCEFVPMPFPKVIAALESNQVQFAASNFIWTAERAQRINFSAKYYRSTTSLVGNAEDSFKDPNALLQQADVRIAVTDQTTQWRYLKQYSTSRITAFLSVGETVTALKQQRVDYALIPTLFALNLLQKPENSHLDFIGPPIDHATLSGDVHLGITQAHPELKDQIDTALKALHDSGQLRALSQKYFPFNVY